MIPRIACLLGLLASHAAAVDPLVKLSYASYNGGALNNGVTQWLGIPYAAPPVDGLRFAAPADLDVENKEYQADSHGPACIGVNESPDKIGESTSSYSEDCLKLDIYAPSSANTNSKLPVFFFIPGGGFTLSSQPPNGTSLVSNSDHEMVFVSLTYRVGPYGFLGGSADALSGASPFSLNNGLKDQQKALKWVKQYISKFGGDPDHIVLGGASAGAGSVVLQLTNSDNEGLFVGAAAESQAWPALLTPEEGQFMYTNLTKETGCSDAQGGDLACMRSMSTKDFQTATKGKTFALPGAASAPVYMYGPTLDLDFIKEYTYSRFWDTDAIKVPSIFGDDTNEGDIFMPNPNTITSLDLADAFVNNQFPGLTTEDFDWLHAHAYYKSTIQASDYKKFASMLYGSLRYICPGLFLSWNYPTRAQNNNIWLYRWDVGTALHTAEQTYMINGGDDGPKQNIQDYWISFIRYLDPNKAKAKNAPTWESSGKDGAWQANRLLFTDDGGDATRMETVDVNQWDQCVYLMDRGLSLQQ